MESARASGILVHPTSFPGRSGIGDLGDAAYRFVDWLAGSAQQLWQIMPLGPTGYGDSPYQAISAFAGNPLLISLERLMADRYLAQWDLDGASAFPVDAVDFGAVTEYKQRLLRLSYRNFLNNAAVTEREQLAAFVEENRGWLDDFALYVALKQQHEGANWGEWETEIATRQPAALKRAHQDLAGEIAYQQWVQYQFFKQWSALKTYANERGIRIIGDIPIFVSYDSADAWSHRDLFYIDEAGKMTQVAGVPPDFFSPTGQLWGNPLYRWNVMAKNGYQWWIDRFRHTLNMVDIARIDHFRGFQTYWSVPAGEEDATNGKWVKGPGAELFRAVEKALGPLPIIAEDLGMITPAVRALRDELGFPGMIVLQFAFTGDPDNLYLPHNHVRNAVVYTGTHDNDTTHGWFWSLSPEDRSNVQKYLARHGDDIAWDLIRAAMMSVADTAIVPLQDVFNLGSEARMNTPGRAMGNWGWRFHESMLNDWFRDRLKGMSEIYGRAIRPPKEPEEEPEETAAEV